MGDSGIRERVGRFFISWVGLLLVGAVTGVTASVLQRLGNPPNIGLCVTCFLRDIAGAIGLHRFPVGQYFRPEIPAMVLGALGSALLFGGFKPRSGSAPLVRFVLGVFAMIGTMVFLGCTWRVFVRLGGGDGTALVGLAGLAVGVGVGEMLIRGGFDLGPPRPAPVLAGLIPAAAMALLLGLGIAGVTVKDGQALFFSAKGPGAMAAPIAASVAFGLLVGLLGHRSGFCTIGGFRQLVRGRLSPMLGALVAFVAGAVVCNLIFGQFHASFRLAPFSHTVHLWNFLPMVLAGLAFCLAGGCPGRQLFLCGEGSADAGVFVVGMVVGAGLTHNWNLAGAPDKMVAGVFQAGGPDLPGKVVVVAGLAFCVVAGLACRRKAGSDG